MERERRFETMKVQTGFTGFFRIYCSPANPEKSCKSCLFF
jgi:hypothetical protein